MSRNSMNNPESGYAPGVYMLTGINGTGKSTIVDMISKDHPDTVALHASLELSKLFNGISREEMEQLDAEEKLGRMVVHFTTIFERAINDDNAVIMDTHLLVPIRTEADLRYEDIWSAEYRQYINSMIMLTASPETIRGWRLRDEVATGRKRSINIADIEADQDANVTRFSQLADQDTLSDSYHVVKNIDGSLGDVRELVENAFQS